MRLSRSASSNARRQSSSEAGQRPRATKVVVVGDGGVGKTCLLSRFVNHTFPMEYIPTVFENHHTELLVDGTSVLLEIWVSFLTNNDFKNTNNLKGHCRTGGICYA